MKRFIVTMLVGISLFVGIVIGCRISNSLTYTVDRIEEGQNGEQWAVVEVYNSITDEISMVDILIEEGYTVQ